MNEVNDLNNLSKCYQRDFFTLYEKYIQVVKYLLSKNVECNVLKKDIDYKQCLIEKYELDMQKQTEIVSHLNHQVFKKYLRHFSHIRVFRFQLYTSLSF